MEHQVIDLTPSYSLMSSGSDAQVFEIVGRETKEEIKTDSSVKDFSSWEDGVINIDGFEVLPYGKDNKLDQELQDSIFPNHIAPRALTKKGSLLYGQGPLLYKTKYIDGKPVREYVKDDEIMSFLEANNYEENILCAIVDYYYSEGCFHKVLLEKSFRISGNGKIAEIEFQDLFNCRLARRKGAKSKKATHVLVGDWKKGSNQNGYKVYPLMDPKQPTKHKRCFTYSKLKSFGFANYAMPDLYGALPWIKRTSTIPYIIEALTNNSINLKFHIKSPQKYWDNLEEQIKKNCEALKKAYTPKLLKAERTKIFKAITDVLSGVDNVGKFWHSIEIQEIVGGKTLLHGWSIEPIEQKTKDFVTSQLEIASYGAFATTAGIGLHNGLLGVGADGKSDSGSEQVYALINHKLTETIIPEMIVMEIWNRVIKQNWPDKKMKLGFYFETSTLMQNVSEKDRPKNNV